MRYPDPLIFDTNTIKSLQELDPEGKNKLLSRLFQTFVTSLERLMDQLAQSQLTHDLATQRMVAHTLKSSSASIGALKLSVLCADIEQMIRAGQEGPFDEQIYALRAEADRVMDSLRLLLGAE